MEISIKRTAAWVNGHAGLVDARRGLAQTHVSRSKELTK